MKYCRYCSHCFSGDCYYCSLHNKVLNRVDNPTNCKDFVMSELGDVDTGKVYNPRKSVKSKVSFQQTKLF